MKKIFTLLLLLTIGKFTMAQVPSLMNYQAVARNAQGQALANQAIKVRLSLNQVDAGGATTFYSETRSVTTNALGLFNVQVGSAGAQNILGNIKGTNWLDSSKTRNLKVEIDVNNSGSFIDMGSQQLVSVPYAFAAKEAETAKKLSTPFYGFRAEPFGYLSNITLPFFPKFGSELHDNMNLYDPVSGNFTVPEDGMYNISYALNIHIPSLVGSNRLEVIVLNLQASGGLETLNLTGSNADSEIYKGVNRIMDNVLMPLKKGDKISLRINAITKTTQWDFQMHGGYFQAYRIN